MSHPDNPSRSGRAKATLISDSLHAHEAPATHNAPTADHVAAMAQAPKDNRPASPEHRGLNSYSGFFAKHPQELIGEVMLKDTPPTPAEVMVLKAQLSVFRHKRGLSLDHAVDAMVVLKGVPAAASGPLQSVIKIVSKSLVRSPEPSDSGHISPPDSEIGKAVTEMRGKVDMVAKYVEHEGGDKVSLPTKTLLNDISVSLNKIITQVHELREDLVGVKKRWEEKFAASDVKAKAFKEDISKRFEMMERDRGATETRLLEGHDEAMKRSQENHQAIIQGLVDKHDALLAGHDKAFNEKQAIHSKEMDEKQAHHMEEMEDLVVRSKTQKAMEQDSLKAAIEDLKKFKLEQEKEIEQLRAELATRAEVEVQYQAVQAAIRRLESANEIRESNYTSSKQRWQAKKRAFLDTIERLRDADEREKSATNDVEALRGKLSRASESWKEMEAVLQDQLKKAKESYSESENKRLNKLVESMTIAHKEVLTASKSYSRDAERYLRDKNELLVEREVQRANADASELRIGELISALAGVSAACLEYVDRSNEFFRTRWRGRNLDSGSW